jgi:threonine/homoserine efflux transporter RhtA
VVSKEFDTKQSHPLEVEEACVYGCWKSKRRGDGKKKNGFGIIIAETRGTCVITIIWLGQKVGREARWAQKIIVVGL